jgi:hypothetical protein
VLVIVACAVAVGPLDALVAAPHALHTRHTKISAAPMRAVMRAAGGWVGSMRVCLSLLQNLTRL